MEHMQKSLQKQLIRRLRIVEGQVRGLQKMVREDTYCVDVITQSEAIRQALSRFDDAMLANHLSTHVAAQMKSGQHKKAVNEVLKIYKLAKR